MLERAFLPSYKVNCLHCAKFKLALVLQRQCLSVFSPTACSADKFPRLLYADRAMMLKTFLPILMAQTMLLILISSAIKRSQALTITKAQKQPIYISTNFLKVYSTENVEKQQKGKE